MKEELRLSIVRIDIEMIDTSRVEGGSPANEAMNLIPLREQQFRQVRAVLPRYASDECTLWHEALRRSSSAY